MFSAVYSLGESLDTALRALARQQLLLISLLVLCNAIFIPYLGLFQDAQLYSGLVLNRLDPELLRTDLFFQYGSQDQYTIFAPLMTPLARWFGVKGAFFVGYVASVALFLAAMVRLTIRMWPDSPGAVVGLLYLAVIQVGYGNNLFHIIEPFLSARLPACALTIWALAEFLDRRWVRGGLCLVAAFSIHPLMTLPGAIVLTVYFLAKRWGICGVLVPTLAALITLFGILAHPPLAAHLFGDFDGQWLEITRLSNAYQFPLEWPAKNWFWNLFALAILGAGAWWSRQDRPDRARLLAAAMLVGAIGFFGSLLFTQLPYALLHKGQAYRWLWLPMALTPPVLCDLAWSAWRTNDLKYRLGSGVIALVLGLSSVGILEIFCVAAFVPIILYGLTIYCKDATWTDKISIAALASIFLGCALWGAYRIWVFATLGGPLREEMTMAQVIQVVFAALAPGVIFPLILAFLAMTGSRLIGPGRAFGFAASALFVHFGLFLGTFWDQSRPHCPRSEEYRFVETFFDQKRSDLTPSIGIYSNLGKLEKYWVDWRVRSFYDPIQLSGFVFNRDTAIEGKRRARLVAPFEAAALLTARWHANSQSVKDEIEEWLDFSVANGPAPEARDLLQLAQEESIDYIVLFHVHFDDLACARKGNVSIYDCRQLRRLRVAPNEPFSEERLAAAKRTLATVANGSRLDE